VLVYVHQAGYDEAGVLDPNMETDETCVRCVFSADGGASWHGDARVQCGGRPLRGSPFGKIRCAADGALGRRL
jgi:hypothetical protein